MNQRKWIEKKTYYVILLCSINSHRLNQNLADAALDIERMIASADRAIARGAEAIEAGVVDFGRVPLQEVVVQPNRGMKLIQENTSASSRAVMYEDAIPGTRYNILMRKRETPVLMYDNPNPRGKNFIKFDGYEDLASGVTLLIDAKRAIVKHQRGRIRSGDG